MKTKPYTLQIVEWRPKAKPLRKRMMQVIADWFPSPVAPVPAPARRFPV